MAAFVDSRLDAALDYSWSLPLGKTAEDSCMGVMGIGGLLRVLQRFPALASCPSLPLQTSKRAHLPPRAPTALARPARSKASAAAAAAAAAEATGVHAAASLPSPLPPLLHQWRRTLGRFLSEDSRPT
jgi:hypothetical protein